MIIPVRGSVGGRSSINGVVLCGILARIPAAGVVAAS